MAGRNSAQCNAKLLILNHISPKLEHDLPGTARDAYEASGKACSVAVAFDFMEVTVPWMGFGGDRSDAAEDASDDMDAAQSSPDGVPKVKDIIQRLFG
jgi:hypothetical protein